MKKTTLILFFTFAFCLLPFHLKAQWTQLPNLPVTGTVWDIYFTNANTGWITLVSPTAIIKTTNGGQNWVTQSNISIRNIQFLDDNTGYGQGFIGTNGTIWKTTNGGVNWNSVLSDGNGYGDISFINKDTGWACGTDGFLGGVWRTTDAGLSFQRELTSTGSSLSKIFFLKEKGPSGYIGWVGEMPQLYRTTNSGISWSLIYSGFTSQCNSLEDIFFSDSINGIITRGGGCINKTTDGGYNWTTINEFHVTAGCRITAVNNSGWVSMATDTIIKTTNSFQTYGKQHLPAFGVKIFAVDTNTVYGAVNMTNVIKTTNGGGPFVSINIISSSVPKSYLLYQNYPNPFNPSTNIKYQIINSDFIHITIYDILGKEIITLVNQKQNAGTYEVTWDASGYPSGTYFYTLQTENFKDTKKLVYLK